MFANRDAVPMVAVKDVNLAREFYEGTLGLKPTGVDREWVSYQSGKSTIMVYQSQYAGTNKATALTWEVGDDLEGLMRALKAKGVTFEQYDLPGTTRKGDLHIAGDMKMAWFKDPDGNILNLASQ